MVYLYICKELNKKFKAMSIHEMLLKDKSYNFIENEDKGIKYFFASNIADSENILSIIKYTMPHKIITAFNTPLKRSRNTLYIQVSYEELHNKYYFIISLANSENYNHSHTEILRITSSKLEDIITKYIEVKSNKKFITKTINALNNCPVTLPIYIIEK